MRPAGLDPDREDNAPRPMASPARNPFELKARQSPLHGISNLSQLPSFTAGIASPHNLAAAAKIPTKTAEKSRQRVKSRPATAERSKRTAQDAASRLQEVIDLTKDRAQPSHSSRKPSGSGDDVIDLEPEASGFVPHTSSNAKPWKSFTAQLREAMAEHVLPQTEEQAGVSARDKAGSHVPSERPHGQKCADLPEESSQAGHAGRERQSNSKPDKDSSKAAPAQTGLLFLPLSCSNLKCEFFHVLQIQEAQGHHTLGCLITFFKLPASSGGTVIPSVPVNYQYWRLKDRLSHATPLQVLHPYSSSKDLHPPRIPFHLARRLQLLKVQALPTSI